MSVRMKSMIAIGAATMTLAAGSLPAQAAEEVNVYSYRQPFLIQPMFDAFTRETGITVNTVFAPEGLVERLKQEGANSPADLIFTVDIGRLSDAYEAGVTQGVETDHLIEAIPPHFRHPEGHWYGLTLRARIVYASKDRLPPEEAPKTYEELADPKWEGRICTRSGSHVYQVALLGAMIAHHGEAEAKEWLEGLKANLAQKPQGGDRAQVKAVMEGVCDIALGNSYYYGAMITDEEQYPWAQSVYPVFPTIAGGGTHVNISGVALTKSAPNRENAVLLMEFLASDLAQQMYAEGNYEYPIVEGVPISGLVKSMGPLEADDLPLHEVAENRSAALKMVNEVAYNE